MALVMPPHFFSNQSTNMDLTNDLADALEESRQELARTKVILEEYRRSNDGPVDKNDLHAIFQRATSYSQENDKRLRKMARDCLRLLKRVREGYKRNQQQGNDNGRNG